MVKVQKEQRSARRQVEQHPAQYYSRVSLCCMRQTAQLLPDTTENYSVLVGSACFQVLVARFQLSLHTSQRCIFLNFQPLPVGVATVDRPPPLVHTNPGLHLQLVLHHLRCTSSVSYPPASQLHPRCPLSVLCTCPHLLNLPLSPNHSTLPAHVMCSFQLILVLSR